MNNLLKLKGLKSKPGVTYVQLVCFDILFSDKPIFTIANTHVNLYGFYLVGDDIMSKPESKDKTSIDALVDMGLDDNLYNSLYFPELMNPDMMPEWVQSIPMLGSLILGNMKEVYIDNRGELYKFDYFDLNRQGKKIYNDFYAIYPDKEIRILTMIKDIF